MANYFGEKASPSAQRSPARKGGKQEEAKYASFEEGKKDRTPLQHEDARRGALRSLLERGKNLPLGLREAAFQRPREKKRREGRGDWYLHGRERKGVFALTV